MSGIDEDDDEISFRPFSVFSSGLPSADNLAADARQYAFVADTKASSTKFCETA
jgi:hypothetical protein